MKYIYITLIASIAMFYSCSNSDFEEAFDKTPNERITEAITKYTDVLTTSEYGWKMSYYPNEKLMGAFHLMMKFDDKNDVQMKFELSDKNITSLYGVKAEDEILLSFDTYNFISLISDPSGFENKVGLGGEFEFNIQSACKDSIVMKSKKERRRAVMYPATEFDWSNNFKKLKEIQNNLKTMPKPVTSSNDYCVRKINFGSKLEDGETVDFNYAYNSRTIKIAYKNTKGDVEVFTRGIEFDHEGFKFNDPIKIKDMIINEFKYNEATSKFIEPKYKGVIEYQINVEPLISDSNDLWDLTWHFTKDYKCSESLKPFIAKTKEILDADTIGIYLFMHSNALTNFSFMREINGGKRWNDFILESINLDNLNNVAFNWSSIESLRYAYNKPYAEKLYKDPVTREFLDILHSPKGWLVVELEFKKKYRMISKQNKNNWFILEEGYQIN